MRVVQGLASEADVSLFGSYCDPVVLTPGDAGRGYAACGFRRCGGYSSGTGSGLCRSSGSTRAWSLYAAQTAMWIDGQRVSLARFGQSDRWLLNFPPADGRNALLREWSIVPLGAKGQHSVSIPGALAQPGCNRRDLEVHHRYELATTPRRFALTPDDGRGYNGPEHAPPTTRD